MNRRNFIASSLAASLASRGAISLSADNAARASSRKRILLRSSWQTINIGDIGHTPGVVALLEKHLPEAEVRLWPVNVRDGVKEMLQRRFPELGFVETPEELNAAFAECDFLLHGSGPWLVSPAGIERWTKATGKPYGVYGISLPPERAGEREVGLLTAARFVFFRDSVSLQVAKEKGVKSPVMKFGPDGAFGVDLRDNEKADAFLGANQLSQGRFLCCIPRYREVPEWLIPRKNRAVNLELQALNERWKEHDHAPLREAIIRLVQETTMKVLICPEDETQMAIGKEMLFDKLPDGVKARVVWRPNFWLTDEALSTYARSAGLFGNEMHSPIMCIGNGIPAIVCRWKQQTSKGIMWRDIGLGDWLFDMDVDSDVAKIAPAVLSLAQDPSAARAKVAVARDVVERLQRETIAEIARHLW